MTFLSMSIESSSLTQEKSLLEYQEICITVQENKITQEMADYTTGGGSNDDSYYASLEAYQETYDSQKSSIESQLEAINAEIDSYEKAIQTNVKNECKLTLSV